MHQTEANIEPEDSKLTLEPEDPEDADMAEEEEEPKKKDTKKGAPAKGKKPVPS